MRLAALLVCMSVQLSAASVTLDFEGLFDGAILTNQYVDPTFTNAIILSAGVSLNEFEFPPHSGVNVVSDNGGPMSIVFASPVLSFSGYFTYAEALSLAAFDPLANQVASVTSLFANNLALSGDPGSSPNEFLQVTFAGGISSLTIIGDQAGGSFVLDDVAITTDTSATVPELSSWVFLLSATGLLVITRMRKLL
jgi:hypothetical protein